MTRPLHNSSVGNIGKTISLLPLAIHESINTQNEETEHPSLSVFANETAETKSRQTRSKSFHFITREGLSHLIQDCLDDSSKNLDDLNDNGLSPLHVAVLENRSEAIRVLLSNNADVDNTGRDGIRPLHLASRHNFVEAAKLLLQHNADVKVQNNQGSTPLHFAARRDNYEVAELLLQEPTLFVDQQDNDGFTPTHLACTNGSVGLCELLLSHKASVQILSNDGKTALHMVAYQGNSDVIKLLIDKAKEKRCNIYDFVNCADMQYYTPLHYAARNGHTSAAAVLINHGAQVDADTSRLNKPLHLAAIGGHQGVTELLLTQGARVNDVDIEQRTPLHRASTYGRESVIRVLLENGGNIEARDERGMTSLLYAVQQGHFETAAFLLENNAHIGMQDITNKTCLHYSIETQNLKGIQLLMNKGANSLLEVTDNTDRTPLHYAASLGDIKIVRLLLENGCEVNPKDETQQTPLHLAAGKGSNEVVEEIMTRTPLDSCDESNRTPLHFAALNGKRKICLSLIRMGAKVNAQDESRQTPLHLASHYGHKTTITALLEKGALIDIADKNKNTSLHHASARGHVAVVNLLLENQADVQIFNIAGQTCLDVAIDNSEDVAMEMVKHSRWQEILNYTSDNRPLPMKTLIAQLPDVAEEVMNRCIQSNDLLKTHTDYAVTYNFRLLDPSSDPTMKFTLKNKFFGPSVMVKHKREMLLAHPLCRKLLDVKWSKFGRWPYYLNLFFFLLFITFFTIYVVSRRTRRTDDSISDLNFNRFTSNITSLGAYVIAFACLQVLIEIGQVVVQGKRYFVSVGNYIDWLMYVSCFLFIAPHMTDSCCFKQLSAFEEFYWTTAIVAIFLTWGNMFLILRQFSGLGIYISMLIDVIRTVLKAFFVFAIFTISFSIVFHVLLFELDEFKSFAFSLMKVTAMTIGEMEYTDTIFQNLNRTDSQGVRMIPQPNTTLVVFYIFSILMPIILMNLLIGLAVGDIDTIQKNAEMEKISMTVNYVAGIEAKYPMAMARWLNIPELVVRPNKKQIKTWWQSFVHKVKSLFKKPSPAVVFEWEDDEPPEETEKETVHRELRKQKQKIKSISSMLEKQSEMLEYIKTKMDAMSPSIPVTSPTEEISTRINHHHGDTTL